MKAQAQKGFTLIELMIVVAIIGILAAIAIPQYQNYIARSQLTRVMNEVAAAKTAVEAIRNDGKTPSTTSTDDCSGANCYIGFDASKSNLISAFTVAADGTMAATLGDNANPAVAGAILTWTRAADGLWTCGIAKSTNAGWSSAFAPAGCPVAP